MIQEIINNISVNIYEIVGIDIINLKGYLYNSAKNTHNKIIIKSTFQEQKLSFIASFSVGSILTPFKKF